MSDSGLDILIFGLNFAPEPTGTGRYTGEMAAWLARRGHRVTAIVGLPHYPQWRLYTGYAEPGRRVETVEGVCVRRVRHFIPSPPRLNGRSRLRMEIHFALSAAQYWLPLLFARDRPDVVIAVAPPLITGLYPMLYRARGVPWILHLQDLQVDVALRLGMLRSPLARHTLPALDRFILRRATAVSTITDAMRRRTVAKGIAPDRVFVFPNWADTHVIQPGPRENPFRKELGFTTDDILVLYAGAFGIKHGLEVLLHAAQHLATQPNLQFVLVGDGADRPRVEQLARELRLTNVRLRPVQPAERLPEMLAAGDIHVVLQKRYAADLVMPSKLANILAAGRPCVATAERGTALHETVAGEGVGLACPSENPTALADAILRLARDAALRQSLGRKARAYAEKHLDRDRILTAFEARLVELAHRGDCRDGSPPSATQERKTWRTR